MRAFDLVTKEELCVVMLKVRHEEQDDQFRRIGRSVDVDSQG